MRNNQGSRKEIDCCVLEATGRKSFRQGLRAARTQSTMGLSTDAGAILTAQGIPWDWLVPVPHQLLNIMTITPAFQC